MLNGSVLLAEAPKYFSYFCLKANNSKYAENEKFAGIWDF